MRLDLLCILVIGYFLHSTNAVKKKDAIIQPQAPEVIQKQPSHHHSVYDTNGHYGTGYNPTGGQIIIHNEYTPEDSYDHAQNVHNPEKKRKSKQKKAGKKSKKQKKKKYGDDQDFKQILQNYDLKPDKTDDGGFKTSVHTEHYEVKKINPNARFPDEKYIIEGAYKVQETDPWGQPVTSFHKYDSPISKIAASILSKYDYTNFRPGESDSYDKDKEEERNHANVEFEDDSNSYGYKPKKSSKTYNPSNYKQPNHYNSYDNGYGKGNKANQDYTYQAPSAKSNGRDYEQSAGYPQFVHEKKAYYTAPVSYGPNHQPQGNKNQNAHVYGNFKTEDSKRVENLKKMPVEVEYIAPHDQDSVQRELEYEFEKEFGHLVYPGHTVGDNYDHDSEYEKFLIDYVYGNEQAASNKFVQKVKPQTIRKV